MTLNWGGGSYRHHWDKGVAMGVGSDATAAFPTLINLDLLKGGRKRIGRPPNPDRESRSPRRPRHDSGYISPEEVSQLRLEIATEVMAEMFADLYGILPEVNLSAGDLLRILAERLEAR